MADTGAIVTVAIVLFVIITVYKAVNVVREKEVIVVERLGKFNEVLTAGVHFIIPYVDRPKTYTFRYFVTTPLGNTQLVNKANQSKILTQNEVLDFPKQAVITRDNAMVHLDAVLNYRIVNPKRMIYSCQNLPLMLSKVLQAQIRNVAGSLDVDQIINETASMDRVSGEIDMQAARWGVKIEFVKVQRVEAGKLESVLAKKKNADLKNQEVIINAKATKQTAVIESEGHRDRTIREAEGEAQQMLSRARGQAQAVLNAARAEARTVKEIARAIARSGENPTRYLLALKYIEALKTITSLPRTTVTFMPHETAFLQTAQGFGLNTVNPPAVPAR
mmetsp:Transcript_15470/g.53745  ORF Transcript_15470/g.53745 Transcript_15470/m.53745 type:complete len:333 (-) Transcript_15470:21-1019(-)